MSLIGNSVAIISIGTSCQTAEQINCNIDLLSELAGEKLLKQSSFFDWLLCDTASIARFLNDFIDRPIRDEDVYLDGRRYGLAGHGLWFWHEHRTDPAEKIAEKYNYLLSKFRALGHLEHRVFVFSNTQNNLPENKAPGRRDFILSADTQTEIARALDKFFPGGRNSILWVSHESMVGDPKPEFTAMEIFDGPWTGSQPDWRRMLERSLCLQGRQTA